MKPQIILLFGATGAIGSAIASTFKEKNWQVVGVGRDPSDLKSIISEYHAFDSVCWAQGANINDSVYNFDEAMHTSLYEANVLYVLKTIHELLKSKALAPRARLCIISSIWQNCARQNKLSYSVSKAALRGLVLSAANDMGRDGYLINAVLPGVLDTPMTRENLSLAQISAISNATQFQRLPTVDDVASAVYGLCNELNTGVTGQFVDVDLGFSHVRVI
jgi:hypothetical protein